MVFSLFSFCSQVISACTTFCINKNGQIVFGRNYDWVTGAGIVNTNQRGLFKTSLYTSDGSAATWISKYGSITFNQFGKEFPTGGMNEKGLVVELMQLDGTTYPAADNRPAVIGLQWIQYQLDNSATTAELIRSDAQIRISTRATPIHFLVADSGGNVATIEFLDGRMTVHKEDDLPFPVLTNNTYASSVQTANSLVDKPGILPGNNSLDRFVKACRMLKRYQDSGSNIPVTGFAFSILDKVAQGSFTKWSIVYDISNKQIHFKTETNKNIKTIEFAAFDFACSQPAKMFNMNQEGRGDVSHHFILPDKKIKQQVMDQVALEGGSRIRINKKQQEDLLLFEYGVSCKQ